MFAGFTFNSRFFLYCFVMFCLRFRARSAPETHTFSVVSGTAFRLLHMLGFLAPGASFSSFFVFTVREPFWLREPSFKEECY